RLPSGPGTVEAMYAVLEDRNQQFRVKAGDRLLIPLNSTVEEGASITFDKVYLLTGSGDVANARIGTSYVEAASVIAQVLHQDVKGPKLVVQKFRRRKNYRRRTGFRARYTEIEIEAIHGT